MTGIPAHKTKGMLLLPNDTLEKIEYHKVLHLLEAHSKGEPGRKAILALRPQTEIFILERLLMETQEYAHSIGQGTPIPIGNYVDLSGEMRMLEVEGSVLPIEDILKIKNQLWIIKDLFRFFHLENQKAYPTVHDILRPISFEEGLIHRISKVVDEEGRIKPSASPELMRIHQAITSKHRELQRKFAETIQEYKSKGWLSESVEGFKNGRRVLSVPAEHKRKIGGIVHDESATGKTVYLEPNAIISINNDLFDLGHEERREVQRILRSLCGDLRPHVPALREYQELLVRLDVVQAKARLALEMNARLPRLKDRPQFVFHKSYHPLLWLKNQKEGKKTVPFELVLHGQNRVLMLSGPNAGGKSVAMKAVGLLQMMLQTGMLVPSAPESEYGIFHGFFSDIGDQQSLEDDLSTYSSRLKNMKAFLQHADDRTLVLIDEFGSGTDPKVGGAIAEAILKELHQKKVFAFVTTHYSNLKVFAFKTPGIVNGAMRFDTDNLSPTYELQVGKPGSSYGFDIADKIGLDKRVVAAAKKKIGKSERAVDQLLIDLQKEKQELEERLAAAESKQKHLDTLVRNYEQLAKDLEVGRKRLKLEMKEWQMQQSARDNQRLEKLVREIKEEKNLEKAKQLAEETRTERKQNTQQVHELKEDIYYKEHKQHARPLQVGDFVKLKTGGATGRVVRIEKRKVEVEMGLLKVSAHLRDLERVGEPLEIQREKRVTQDVVEQRAKFETKLDIRGMRRDEALQLLERYLDEAVMTGVEQIEIIHGKGTGTLRQAVHQKLREYPAVLGLSHPEAKKGGDGVTQVELS